jgi:hypothetical protein
VDIPTWKCGFAATPLYFANLVIGNDASDTEKKLQNHISKKDLRYRFQAFLSFETDHISSKFFRVVITHQHFKGTALWAQANIEKWR